MKLFKIRGGVHPDDCKSFSSEKSIEDLPMPEMLYIPVQQHIGQPAEPVVQIGDHVKKGQLVASARGAISANIHAPTSGTITEIGPYIASHASGLETRTIFLKPDGQDQWGDMMPPLSDQATPAEMAKRVGDAGIVGMGGATFPSAVKLNLRNRFKPDTLIINGAECEPYLTCDDRLMREHTAGVIRGIALMKKALGVTKALIAIEKNKPQAINALKAAAIDLDDIVVIGVPARYPMGSEKHLTQALTGKETPARGLTADIGVVVHNVATAFAVYEAVDLGKPLISRVVTVTGGAIKTPKNLRILIGTPARDLIKEVGGINADTLARVIFGGPMMGQPLRSEDIAIVKGMNGIVALSKKEVQAEQSMPCIRCASCVSACPCGLMPLEMASRIRADELDGAVNYGLMDCVACGSCSYVCPSHIPLVHFFNYAKGKLTEQQRSKHKAEEIKRLTEARSIREEKEKAAKKAAMEKKKAIAAARKKAKLEAEAKKKAEAASAIDDGAATPAIEAVKAEAGS